MCVCAEVFVFSFFLSLLCTVYASCMNQGGCIWPRLSSLLAPVRLVFPSPKSNISKRSHRGFVVEQAELRCSLSFLDVHFYCNFYCGQFPANPMFFFHTTFPFAMRAYSCPHSLFAQLNTAHTLPGVYTFFYAYLNFTSS